VDLDPESARRDREADAGGYTIKHAAPYRNTVDISVTRRPGGMIECNAGMFREAVTLLVT